MLTINGKEINQDSTSFVIAEIGNNHQGSLELAKQLVDEAKGAGASAIKTQRRDNKELYTADFFDKAYDSSSSFGKTYGEHRENLELSENDFVELLNYCEENKIFFFSTAFDMKSADFLREIGIKAFKIASGDLRSLPLIEHICSFGLPIIASTGGGSAQEVDQLVNVITAHHDNCAVLQCTASYPCAAEDLNLKVIETFRNRYPNLTVGLSDHFSGILSSPLAYMLGARVFEKHFTLNRAMKGTDHAFSLEPSGLKKLVRDLERTEKMLGDGFKRKLDIEKEPIRKMGKMLVAARDIAVGEQISIEDIQMKSPCEGIEPDRINEVIGKKANSNISQGQKIEFSILD